MTSYILLCAGFYFDLLPQEVRSTILGRTTAFNRHNVMKFSDKLNDVFLKHILTALQIQYLDEAGIQTVFKSHKIIAIKGITQVEAVVSAQYGNMKRYSTNVSVSSSGNQRLVYSQRPSPS